MFVQYVVVVAGSKKMRGERARNLQTSEGNDWHQQTPGGIGGRRERKGASLVHTQQANTHTHARTRTHAPIHPLTHTHERTTISYLSLKKKVWPYLAGGGAWSWHRARNCTKSCAVLFILDARKRPVGFHILRIVQYGAQATKKMSFVLRFSLQPES